MNSHILFFAQEPCWKIHRKETWHLLEPTNRYGVATISRLHEIIGLFCQKALQKRLYSAKETYNFKEPTNRSHPILPHVASTHQQTQIQSRVHTTRPITNHPPHTHTHHMHARPHTCIKLHAHTCACTHQHTHTHVRTHTRAHTHTHTHIHTHIQDETERFLQLLPEIYLWCARFGCNFFSQLMTYEQIH